MSLLYVIAFTPIQFTAGSGTLSHEVQVQYNGIVQNLYLYDRPGINDYQQGKGDLWKFNLTIYGCITISAIERVSVVQTGNGSWRIESIVTLVKDSSDEIQLLTRDFNVYRLIDGSNGNSQRQFNLTFAGTYVKLFEIILIQQLVDYAYQGQSKFVCLYMKCA